MVLEGGVHPLSTDTCLSHWVTSISVLFNCEMHHPPSLAFSSPWKWLKGWEGWCVRDLVAGELGVLAPATTSLLTCCSVWHCGLTFCNCVLICQSSKGERSLHAPHRLSVEASAITRMPFGPCGFSGICFEPAFRSTFNSNLGLLQKTQPACHVC